MSPLNIYKSLPSSLKVNSCSHISCSETLWRGAPLQSLSWEICQMPHQAKWMHRAGQQMIIHIHPLQSLIIFQVYQNQVSPLQQSRLEGAHRRGLSLSEYLSYLCL